MKSWRIIFAHLLILPMSRKMFYWWKILILVTLVWTDLTAGEYILGYKASMLLYLELLLCNTIKWPLDMVITCFYLYYKLHEATCGYHQTVSDENATLSDTCIYHGILSINLFPCKLIHFTHFCLHVCL